MQDILLALSDVFTVTSLIWLVGGFLIGVLVGATPGIGPELGILLAMPFTLGLEPAVAMMFLVAIYVGGDYGGSIPAILLNTPGTAASAATVLDGYPMAKQGRAVTALAISGTGGALGSLLAGMVIIPLIPIMGVVILWFGTPEYFMMAVLGLSTIAVTSSNSPAKGLIVAALGGLIATVGSNSVIVDRRFTFGVPELSDGFALVPAFIGLFAVAEMVKLAEKGSIVAETGASNQAGSRSAGIRIAFQNWLQVLKSAMIGLWVGVMPGQGGTVANYLAYTEAKVSSRESESFGEGNPVGVLAPETANNAIVPGTLVPTLSFGIPGSASAAILLGALLLHGVRPGPDMFQKHLPITYMIFISILVASLVLFAFGVGMAKQLGKIPTISVAVLVPVVITISLIGTYAIEQNWFHVWAAIGFGALSLLLAKLNYPVIPFIMGFILGPIAEHNLARSLMISEGDWSIFLRQPVSAALAALSLIILLFVPARKMIGRKKTHATAVNKL